MKDNLFDEAYDKIQPIIEHFIGGVSDNLLREELEIFLQILFVEAEDLV
jgi:hypothetical protein